MGIGSFLISKAVLPIGIVALIGVGLFAFRTQILGAVQGGAGVLGQAITSPFGSFLQGIKSGFGTIPESIDFRLPSFNFIFGQSDPSNDPIGQLQKDFDDFLKNSQAFLDNLFKSAGGSGGGSPPGQTMLDDDLPTNVSESSGLTPFAKSFITTTKSGIDVNFMRETLEEIQARNKEAIGLFDFAGTTDVTEFFALSQAEIEFFGAENLIFSGQLFKEVKNLQEAINFA